MTSGTTGRDLPHSRLVRRTANPWLLLVFFWFIYFLNLADRQVLFSVLPLIKLDLK